jgi:hypothetical protein
VLTINSVAFFSDVLGRIDAWWETETLAQVLGADSMALLPPVVTAMGVGAVPVLFVFLMGNVVTQFLCITGVYQLTAVANTLSCTMAVTVRKFLSLVVSVWYFSNPFSAFHWLGTVFVFLGVLQYADVMPLARLFGFTNGRLRAPSGTPTDKGESDNSNDDDSATIVEPKSTSSRSGMALRPRRKNVS